MSGIGEFIIGESPIGGTLLAASASAPPVYTAADYAGEFLALLPTGPMWPRDADAPMVQFVNALTPTYERINARDANLLSDAFPVTPLELLPEWESTLGLPDPCTGPNPTVQQRQLQVAARFIASGGQSEAYFIALAAALGASISITQYAPFKFGQTFGLPMYGSAWAFAWQVNAPTIEIEYFLFGRNSFGDPFATWSTTAAVLECEIQRLAPAHTVVIVNTTSSGDGPQIDEAGNVQVDEAGNIQYDETGP